MDNQLVVDPVCGMTIDPADAAGSSEYKGQTFYFCIPECKEKFDSDPEAYLAPRREQAARPGVEWTCPMHPEIVRDAPGSCPICGMALEPRTITLEEPDNPELRSMTLRFWVSVVLTAPLIVIAMMHRGTPVIELALATPVVLWGGWPFFVRAIDSIRYRALNMFTLIGLGVAVAYGYSVVATIAGGFLLSMGVYFEAAAAIVTLVLLGQVLELRARARTGHAIRALLGLAPKTARRVEANGNETDVPLEAVRPGDLLPADLGLVSGQILQDKCPVTAAGDQHCRLHPLIHP